MNPKPPVLIICGPTASGKSRLALSLARRFDGEIVSADSMQVYKGMDIGTAKPSAEERHSVRHHMIDVVHPWQDFSAAQYGPMARDCIELIHAKNKLPILCGGTGLYIHAAVYAPRFGGGSADVEFRERMAEFAQTHGNEALHKKLIEIAPERAGQIHPNNVRRVIRALEIAQTGDPRLQDQAVSNYDLCWIGISMDRQELYRRIDARVDSMLEGGLLDEVASIKDLLPSTSTARQAIGYKELIAALDGECGVAEAVERIKRETRKYAKRQMTWFKREKEILWLEDSPLPEMVEQAQDYIRLKLNIL